jgi:hypothetical protein
MDLSKYYLDLDKVNKLPEKEQEVINGYFKDMLYCDTSRPDIINCIFNTLYHNGYLINVREEKINDVLK